MSSASCDLVDSNLNSNSIIKSASKNIHWPNCCESKILQLNVVRSNVQNISIQNSSHIQLGNKKKHETPVTIQQFLKQNTRFNKLRSLNKKVAVYLLIGILICYLLTLVLLVILQNNRM